MEPIEVSGYLYDAVISTQSYEDPYKVSIAARTVQYALAEAVAENFSFLPYRVGPVGEVR